MVDTKAFRSLSYGLYIVTAVSDKMKAGCVVNTFSQVTSNPAQASIAINKENATTGVILDAGCFEVSVLAQDAPMELIGRFGFHTSVDMDKFAETETSVDEEGIPYVAEHSAAHFRIRVKQTMDLGTHLFIMGEVEEAAVLSDEPPMTYAYYHQVKGGKTPPKASSYEPPEEPASLSGDGSDAPRIAWRCTVCGHIEYVDELPDDFVCPICGVGKDMFERIEL